MKRLIKLNNFVCFILLVAFGLTGCEQSTSPAEPVNPENYPTATFTADFQGNTVAEGDTIMYQVTTDKPLERAVTIELSISGDSLEESDYQYEPVTIPAYSEDTVNVPIIFPNDGIPEKESKELSIALEDQDLGTRYTLNPDTEYPSMDITLENYNDPNNLTVVLGWENSNTDIDMWLNMVDDGSYASYDGDGDGLVLWGSAATGDNPEIMKIPSNDVPANGGTGEYYVEFDPFELAEGVTTVNYKYSVGYPDQTVEYYEGTFDTESLEAYTADSLDSNYDGSTVWTVYRMLEVNLNASGDFTVTSTN